MFWKSLQQAPDGMSGYGEPDKVPLLPHGEAGNDEAIAEIDFNLNFLRRASVLVWLGFTLVDGAALFLVWAMVGTTAYYLMCVIFLIGPMVLINK